MLDLKSWRHHADGLEIGQSVRVDHDCGPGRTLKVNRDERGYFAWCWRCNDGGADKGPEESLAERIARIQREREQDHTIRSGGELPTPAVRNLDDWPMAHRLWLYKAGLGRDLIASLGAYYHPPTDRVVLPVQGGRYWQARAVGKRKPKYLGPPNKPADLLAKWGDAAVVTLTEDILSAFKVGLDHEGWAILGTSISPHMIAELMRRGNRVNLWLDPDPAGRKAAARYEKQLRAYGFDVRNIVTETDPKLTHRETIRTILNVLP